MPAAKMFPMPASVIILDLIGTLLLLVGSLDLMNAALMGPVSQLASGYGWPLVIAGGVSILVGSGLFISKLLTAQRAQTIPSSTAAIQTVDRRRR
jgi:hypothetical protein